MNSNDGNYTIDDDLRGNVSNGGSIGSFSDDSDFNNIVEGSVVNGVTDNNNVVDGYRNDDDSEEGGKRRLKR